MLTNLSETSLVVPRRSSKYLTFGVGITAALHTTVIISYQIALPIY